MSRLIRAKTTENCRTAGFCIWNSTRSTMPYHSYVQTTLFYWRYFYHALHSSL